VVVFINTCAGSKERRQRWDKEVFLKPKKALVLLVPS